MSRLLNPLPEGLVKAARSQYLGAEMSALLTKRPYTRIERRRRDRDHRVVWSDRFRGKQLAVVTLTR